MKKILTILMLLCLSMGAMAQKGQTAIGANLLYGNDTNLGVAAKLRYNITDKLRVEPAFEYFFKHDHVSTWDLGASLQYLIPVAPQVQVYPLAGLAYFKSKVSGHGYEASGDGKVGFNLGAGVDFPLSSCILSLEAKFQIVDGWDQLVVGAGFAIPF